MADLEEIGGPTHTYEIKLADKLADKIANWRTNGMKVTILVTVLALAFASAVLAQQQNINAQVEQGIQNYKALKYSAVGSPVPVLTATPTPAAT